MIVLAFLIVGCEANNKSEEIHIDRVINLQIDKALEVLEKCGVKNVTTNIDEFLMWDRTKLIVVDQSIIGNRLNTEEVVLDVEPLKTIDIEIVYSSYSKKDYNIRVEINNETVGILSQGQKMNYSAETLGVLYVSFYDNGNNHNYSNSTVLFKGNANWQIEVEANDKVIIKKELIFDYIYQ